MTAKSRNPEPQNDPASSPSAQKPWYERLLNVVGIHTSSSPEDLSGFFERSEHEKLHDAWLNAWISFYGPIKKGGGSDIFYGQVTRVITETLDNGNVMISEMEVVEYIQETDKKLPTFTGGVFTVERLDVIQVFVNEEAFKEHLNERVRAEKHLREKAIINDMDKNLGGKFAFVNSGHGKVMVRIEKAHNVTWSPLNHKPTTWLNCVEVEIDVRVPGLLTAIDRYHLVSDTNLVSADLFDFESQAFDFIMDRVQSREREVAQAREQEHQARVRVIAEQLLIQRMAQQPPYNRLDVTDTKCAWQQASDIIHRLDVQQSEVNQEVWEDIRKGFDVKPGPLGTAPIGSAQVKPIGTAPAGEVQTMPLGKYVGGVPLADWPVPGVPVPSETDQVRADIADDMAWRENQRQR